MKVLRSQRIHVAPQQRVGGQHHIVIRHLHKQPLTLRPLQGQQAQPGGHAFGLKLPVEDGGRGQHHQHRQVESSRVFFG